MAKLEGITGRNIQPTRSEDTAENSSLNDALAHPQLGQQKLAKLHASRDRQHLDDEQNIVVQLGAEDDHEQDRIARTEQQSNPTKAAAASQTCHLWIGLATLVGAVVAIATVLGLAILPS